MVILGIETSCDDPSSKARGLAYYGARSDNVKIFLVH